MLVAPYAMQRGLGVQSFGRQADFTVILRVDRLIGKIIAMQITLAYCLLLHPILLTLS